ncbi:32476_t:CDS:1, partial [Racocetra persica]
MGLTETGLKQEIVFRLLKKGQNQTSTEKSTEEVGITKKGKEMYFQFVKCQNDLLLELE